jgi:hypothetical protein
MVLQKFSIGVNPPANAYFLDSLLDRLLRSLDRRNFGRDLAAVAI